MDGLEAVQRPAPKVADMAIRHWEQQIGEIDSKLQIKRMEVEGLTAQLADARDQLHLGEQVKLGCELALRALKGGTEPTEGILKGLAPEDLVGEVIRRAVSPGDGPEEMEAMHRAMRVATKPKPDHFEASGTSPPTSPKGPKAILAARRKVAKVVEAEVPYTPRHPKGRTDKGTTGVRQRLQSAPPLLLREDMTVRGAKAGLTETIVKYIAYEIAAHGPHSLPFRGEKGLTTHEIFDLFFRGSVGMKCLVSFARQELAIFNALSYAETHDYGVIVTRRGTARHATTRNFGRRVREVAFDFGPISREDAIAVREMKARALRGDVQRQAGAAKFTGKVTHAA